MEFIACLSTVLIMPMTSGQAIAHNSGAVAAPASGTISITSAHWKHRYKRFVVEGMGSRGQAIAVTNADTGAKVGRTSVRYDK